MWWWYNLKFNFRYIIFNIVFIHTLINVIYNRKIINYIKNFGFKYSHTDYLCQGYTKGEYSVWIGKNYLVIYNKDGISQYVSHKINFQEFKNFMEIYCLKIEIRKKKICLLLSK